MNPTKELVRQVALLNPEAGEIGDGMLHHIVALARELEKQGGLKRALRDLRDELDESAREWKTVPALAVRLEIMNAGVYSNPNIFKVTDVILTISRDEVITS